MAAQGCWSSSGLPQRTRGARGGARPCGQPGCSGSRSEVGQARGRAAELGLEPGKQSGGPTCRALQLGRQHRVQGAIQRVSCHEPSAAKRWQPGLRPMRRRGRWAAGLTQRLPLVRLGCPCACCTTNKDQTCPSQLGWIKTTHPALLLLLPPVAVPARLPTRPTATQDACCAFISMWWALDANHCTSSPCCKQTYRETSSLLIA